MKITFVVHGFNLRGGTRVIAIYADVLRRLGHEVTVVSPDLPTMSLPQKFRYLLKNKSLPTKSVYQYDFFDELNVEYKIAKNKPTVTDEDVPDSDVIVATWWTTAEWVAKLSDYKGTKVYFVQGYDPYETYYKPRTEATYSLPFHKIVVCQHLVDFLKNYPGNDSVSLVPNSVDLKLFDAEPRTKQSLPTVGLMYSTVYYKGVDISLKAFEIAAKTVTNLKLVVFGDRLPDPKLPLPEGVDYHYQPPQESLKHLYASCDAWLFGSRVEGFGLPILEAMACRTPLIATPAGAAPELLATGGGILVRSEDPEDMARAIVDICNCTQSEWQTISDIAYKQATEYTWEQAGNLFAQALQFAKSNSSKYPIDLSLG